MPLKEGWTGRVYEDFEVGDIYQHPLGRTVLPVDNSWFTLLTQNTNPIHFDRHYAKQTEFDQRLAELCLLRIVTVEVNGIGVLRQQREPAVVHRQHRPAERMLIDVANLEVLVDPS